MDFLDLHDEYDRKHCNAAIRGEKVPDNLYGQNDAINRALNARSIMSNLVPDIDDPSDMPYCIWYPHVATEETYRQLAARYPEMQYQVGRACAVAGYVNLYKELDLLPDVHIAEEARDNGCDEIITLVMGQPARYDVMNDYTRTVNHANPPAARLNGDTAVRSTLDIKRAHSASMHRPYSDITEDWNVDTQDTQVSLEEEVTHDPVTPLLYSPLPVDLPTAHKDLLILVAAFNGDIDRYVRLRRPVFIEKEHICVIRGIFHNTMFAKWWSTQDLLGDKTRLEDPSRLERIQSEIGSAISARYIMNNDFSRILAKLHTAPGCIWYPNVALESVYRALARMLPDMIPAVARACIVADYPDLFAELPTSSFRPTLFMMREAEESRNPFFVADLKRRAAGLGIKTENRHTWDNEDRRYDFDTIYPTVRQLSEGKNEEIYRRVGTFAVRVGAEFYNIYNYYGCGIEAIEVSLCAPGELKKKYYYNFNTVYEDEEFLKMLRARGEK
ncbi:hypothetical protein BDW66DRAFT_163694 [Aspergillus desertorum]